MVVPPDQQRPAERTSRLAIWLAFAGAIVAACIGGAFTIAAAFIDGDGDAPAPPAQAPRDGASLQTGPAAGGTTAGSPDAGAGQAAVRVRGDVVLQVSAGGDKLVLDADPLEKGEPFQPADFSVWSITVSGKAWVVVDNLGNSRVALWTAGRAPSYRECRDAARKGLTEVYPETGDRLCVRTHEGRTAMVLISAVNRADRTVSADVTVWAPTE
jgi:hypothetical protein